MKRGWQVPRSCGTKKGMFDPIAVFVAGLCVGGGAVWGFAQSRAALHLARLAAGKDAERAEMQACVASLKTELAHERQAATEKLTLLNDAQRRLSETFQALSAEALRRNNTSFLELANISLERFQESAKGDLEKRQTAITELVKPVRESLDKVDAKIQEIEKTRAGAYEALTTLISLLKAVFYGWRQERLAENAEEISCLGRELYKRLSDMSGHMERMGRSLNNAVEHFNKLAATTESRVLVTARKFRDLEPAQPGSELEPPTQVETTARELQAPELL